MGRIQDIDEYLTSRGHNLCPSDLAGLCSIVYRIIDRPFILTHAELNREIKRRRFLKQAVAHAESALELLSELTSPCGEPAMEGNHPDADLIPWSLDEADRMAISRAIAELKQFSEKISEAAVLEWKT